MKYGTGRGKYISDPKGQKMCWNKKNLNFSISIFRLVSDRNCKNTFKYSFLREQRNINIQDFSIVGEKVITMLFMLHGMSKVLKQCPQSFCIMN